MRSSQKINENRVKRESYPFKASYLFKPQVALGLTFNWGALMGYSAVTGEMNLAVQLPIYAASFFWTMAYDTAYAFQDIDDDKKLGLNTSADFR